MDALRERGVGAVRRRAGNERRAGGRRGPVPGRAPAAHNGQGPGREAVRRRSGPARLKGNPAAGATQHRHPTTARAGHFIIPTASSQTTASSRRTAPTGSDRPTTGRCIDLGAGLRGREGESRNELDGRARSPATASKTGCDDYPEPCICTDQHRRDRDEQRFEPKFNLAGGGVGEGRCPPPDRGPFRPEPNDRPEEKAGRLRAGGPPRLGRSGTQSVRRRHRRGRQRRDVPAKGAARTNATSRWTPGPLYFFRTTGYTSSAIGIPLYRRNGEPHASSENAYLDYVQPQTAGDKPGPTRSAGRTTGAQSKVADLEAQLDKAREELRDIAERQGTN